MPGSEPGGPLEGVFLLDLEVVATSEIAPHVRSITVGSADLLEFEFSPGQDLTIDFPDGDSTVRRRYTIRRADPTAGTVDLEFELHGGGGVAARWAADAEVGIRLDGIGPRGKISLRPDAAAHLFVADDSSMPATFAMIEALPTGVGARAVLVTPNGAESRPGPGDVTGVDVRWIGDSGIEGALAGLAGSHDGLAAYVLGERRLVTRVVDQLTKSGLDGSAISSKAYWRRDQPNAAHGEPARD